MNTDVKEILNSTEDDIKKLIEERASFLKNNLRFDTQYKVIYSLMLYVNIYYIYSGERELLHLLLGALFTIKLIAGLILEKLAGKTDDVYNLEKLNKADKIVTTVSVFTCIAATISLMLDIKY